MSSSNTGKVFNLTGANGSSAYQYAVKHGYDGTEEEFWSLLANAADKRYVDDVIGNIEEALKQI